MQKDLALFVNDEKKIGILRVLVPLDAPMRQQFMEFTEKLLECKHQNLLLDLSGIDQIFSLFIGSIVDLHHRAVEKQKTLIVAVTPKVAKLFEVLSFDRLLNLKVVTK